MLPVYYHHSLSHLPPIFVSLRDDEMLQAICFVFSRKGVESCAKDITTNLLEFDSKVPYTMKRDCDAKDIR